METTPQPSACFRECCPFYYLWKSEWYFYILWCSFTVIKKKECGNFYSCVKSVSFGFVSAAAATWFFPAAASARLRGRLLLAAATLEASLLNTSMLWLFENALKMWGVEGKRTGVLLPLLLEPTPFSPSISLSWSAVLVLTGPLILHFCVRLTADCQHVFGAKIQTVFPNAFQNGLKPESSSSGKPADACHAWVHGEDITVLLSTFLERNLKHFTPSVVLFLRRPDHSVIMTSRWQSATYSAFFFFFCCWKKRETASESG